MSGAAAASTAVSTIISNVISWAFTACALIGSWFTYKKMGLPGWKGIIPYYNMYVLFDTVWEKKKFWRYIIYTAVTVGLAVLFSIFCVFCVLAAVTANSYDVSRGSGMWVLFAVMLVLSILSFIAMIVMCVLLLILQYKLVSRLAQSFGRAKGFAVGLLFLYPIFIMILGFDKSVYDRGRVVENKE